MPLFHKLLILYTLFATNEAGLKDREFKLDKVEQCQPKQSSYVMLFDVKQVIMKNNIFITAGSCDVTETLGRSMALSWKFRRCPMNTKECSVEYEFPIPNFCLLMGAKTPFGEGLGKFVTPKFTCPIKKGHYVVNMTIPLHSIVEIPASRMKYHIKMMFLDSQKKKSVGCIEMVAWVKHT